VGGDGRTAAAGVMDDRAHDAGHTTTVGHASPALPAPVAARASQAVLADVLPRAFAELDASLRTLVAPLDARRRSTAPPWGGWTVDQVLEHLCIANTAYLRRLRPLIAQGDGAATGDPSVTWRASLAGRLLLWSLQRPAPLPAPGAARPGTTARPDVLDALGALHAEFAALVTATRHRPWRAVRFRSPLADVVRMNLGDAFLVNLVHGRRHAAQIARIVDAVS
jgi:hypothetical protein